MPICANTRTAREEGDYLALAQYVAMAAAYAAQLEDRLPQQDTARGGMAQDTPAPTAPRHQIEQLPCITLTTSKSPLSIGTIGQPTYITPRQLGACDT